MINHTKREIKGLIQGQHLEMGSDDQIIPTDFDVCFMFAVSNVVQKSKTTTTNSQNTGV